MHCAATDSNYPRLQKVIYPNGREVYYRYAESISSALNRPDAIGPSDANVATYAYLGAGTVVRLSYPEVTNTLSLDYDPNGNSLYEGFDRFGRVVDHKWATGGSLSSADAAKRDSPRAADRPADCP